MTACLPSRWTPEAGACKVTVPEMRDFVGPVELRRVARKLAAIDDTVGSRGSLVCPLRTLLRVATAPEAGSHDGR